MEQFKKQDYKNNSKIYN